jgi:solute carrier family 25 carnitine/acylcarnitine transporter 20/29
MASPLIGVAGVNSLLFASYAISKRIVSPFPDLSIPQTAGAGALAGAVNSLLASPVEMFKIRMQGQYGQPGDKRLSKVVSDMWREWGFRRGIMRGFWVKYFRSFLINPKQ